MLQWDPGWTKDILDGTIEPGVIQNYERSEEFEAVLRLGIYYLFEYGPGRAAYKLNEASRKTSNEGLKEALSHVYGTNLLPQSMLLPAYKRIKLARQFAAQVLA